MFTSRTRLCAALIVLPAPISLAAQAPTTPLNRFDAKVQALRSSPLLGAAAADTLMGGALMLGASLREDPSLASSWTKSVPRWHFEISWPLTLPGVRNARMGAGKAALAAAELRWDAAKAEVALIVDTLYTRALAAKDGAKLSQLDAAAARELLRITTLRRDAGDASDLDVLLARLNLGQRVDEAATDSLESRSLRLELGRLLGAAGESAGWVLVDSLREPLNDISTNQEPLAALLAANASVKASQLAVNREHAGKWSGFSLLTGIEFGDPSGVEARVSPVLGISIPLPLFNGSRGSLAEAEAEYQAALAQRQESISQWTDLVSRSNMALATAQLALDRDGELLNVARDVDRMASLAYREGETPLTTVLEAGRSLREIKRLHLRHLADGYVARAVLEALSGLEHSAP